MARAPLGLVCGQASASLRRSWPAGHTHWLAGWLAGPKGWLLVLSAGWLAGSLAGWLAGWREKKWLGCQARIGSRDSGAGGDTAAERASAAKTVCGGSKAARVHELLCNERDRHSLGARSLHTLLTLRLPARAERQTGAARHLRAPFHRRRLSTGKPHGGATREPLWPPARPRWLDWKASASASGVSLCRFSFAYESLVVCAASSAAAAATLLLLARQGPARPRTLTTARRPTELPPSGPNYRRRQRQRQRRARPSSAELPGGERGHQRAGASKPAAGASAKRGKQRGKNSGCVRQKRALQCGPLRLACALSPQASARGPANCARGPASAGRTPPGGRAGRARPPPPVGQLARGGPAARSSEPRRKSPPPLARRRWSLRGTRCPRRRSSHQRGPAKRVGVSVRRAKWLPLARLTPDLRPATGRQSVAAADASVYTSGPLFVALLWLACRLERASRLHLL